MFQRRRWSESEIDIVLLDVHVWTRGGRSRSYQHRRGRPLLLWQRRPQKHRKPSWGVGRNRARGVTGAARPNPPASAASLSSQAPLMQPWLAPKMLPSPACSTRSSSAVAGSRQGYYRRQHHHMCGLNHLNRHIQGLHIRVIFNGSYLEELLGSKGTISYFAW